MFVHSESILTPRETAVLALIVNGSTSKDAAKVLPYGAARLIMERTVVGRSRDGHFLARYSILVSSASAKTPVSEYFKPAAQNALDDKLVSETDLPTLLFTFEK